MGRLGAGGIHRDDAAGGVDDGLGHGILARQRDGAAGIRAGDTRGAAGNITARRFGTERRFSFLALRAV